MNTEQKLDQELFATLPPNYSFIESSKLILRLRYLDEFGIRFDGIQFTTKNESPFHPIRIMVEPILYWIDAKQWEQTMKFIKKEANKNHNANR